MRSQRLSSGSPPLKSDDSNVHGPRSRPAVMTPIEMWVESSVWWRERRREILRGRRPMHERGRTERRFADRRATERQSACGVHRHAPRERRLHQQIVWMLAIDKRRAVVGLADLKELSIASGTSRSRDQG